MKLTVGCAQNSSSKWAQLGLPRCPEAELSQERGWGRLGCWGYEAKTEHLWSCVVPCSGMDSATSHRSSVGCSFVGPHKEPATKGRALLPSQLLHLLFASCGSSPKANSHCTIEKCPSRSEGDAILILYCCLYRNAHPRHLC